MTFDAALRFIEEHGIVLEAGRGPAPSLADRVLGGAIRGSWWSHPRAKAFFWLTRTIRDHPDVLVCRLVKGKVTYVHRRLWPPLVRLARLIGGERLTAIREIHTPSGRHVVEETAFPKWVPADVRADAARLGASDARRALDCYPAVSDALNPSASAHTPRAVRARAGRRARSVR